MSVLPSVSVSRLAILALVLLCFASPDAIACTARPSVSLTTTGPDNYGDFQLHAAYSFPDFTTSTPWWVRLGGQGPGLGPPEPDFGVSYAGPDAEGKGTITVGTA